MADFSFLNTLDKPVAIFGYGISGKAVADACAQAKIAFTVWDEQNNYGTDFTNHLEDYAFLVPSAGIKPTHPIIREAIAKNIPIYSDVDLLLQSAPDAHVVAITGTNGKSTTTALIGFILEQTGKKVAVGGNIGHAACSLPSLDADGIYVLELSSYMLHNTANPMADIAVHLNITPDHLDWHGSFEHYKSAKDRIFRQRENRAPQVRIYGVSSRKPTEDFSFLPPHDFLKGEHNRENMIAALQACRACGLDDATILKHMAAFQGLAHRQKKVGSYKHIAFINDSKATNADATSKALASYDNIYWILGGLPKSDGINGLDVFYPKIKKAYLIGQASQEFAKVLDGSLPFMECGVMHTAIDEAFYDALNDDKHAVILLSPACASFDQYKSFEARGDDFTAHVQKILQDRGV